MNEYLVNVFFHPDLNDIIVTPSLEENLVMNDYNSTVLKFEFDIEADKFLFKLVNGEKKVVLVEEIKDQKIILNRGALSTEGEYKFEISAYQKDSRLTNYATYKFRVRKELVGSDEIELPSEEIKILDQLIHDVSNLENIIDVAEGKRAVAEENRVKAEEGRSSAEQQRIHNELDRENNEAKRKSNEDQRDSSEITRKSNEEIRITNEKVRIENEKSRINSEKIRNESEVKREEYIQDLKSRVDSGEFNGECNFATFEVNVKTGQLEMNKADDLLLDFRLNEKGELEVLIDG